MNKEAIPLILALLTPIFFVSLVIIHFNGFDLISLFRKIDLIYYIIIIPIALGLLVAIIKFKNV
jgi:hypothetical protein